MKRKNFIFAFTLFLSFNILSSEIDSFSVRDKVLGFSDSSSSLNQFFNKRLNDALRLANSWSNKQKCSKQYLEDAVLSTLSGPAIPYPIGDYYSIKWVYGVNGYLETAIDKGKDPTSTFFFKSYRPKKRDSIYKDITVWESLPINRFMGSVINYKGLIIGSDKFGHFISEGYELYLEGGLKNLKKVLAYSELLERGVLGLKTSGVYSYGDLSANFMGMVFWEKLMGDQDSYVTCNDRKWEINDDQQFDWDSYAFPAWDEGLNPSRYYSKKTHDKIKTQILNLKDDSLTPSFFTQKCEESLRFLHKKFKEDSILIINSVISPLCLEHYRHYVGGRFKWPSEEGTVPGEQTEFMGPTWWIL